MSTIAQVEPLIREKCSELGFELFEARFFRAGSRSIVRIFIDSPSGVTIADCEKVSSTLSILLDVEAFLNGRPYTLEVSSPGIDRPLKNERDFKRTYGREVTINCKEAVNGKKVIRGVVMQCENNVLFLKLNETVFEISLDQILSGKEELRFK